MIVEIVGEKYRDEQEIFYKKRLKEKGHIGAKDVEHIIKDCFEELIGIRPTRSEVRNIDEQTLLGDLIIIYEFEKKEEADQFKLKWV